MKTFKKHRQNVIIDLVSLAFLVVLLLTGLLIHYVLPPGSHNNLFWNLSRHDWGEVHFWLAIGFVITILFHLFLHFSWIKAIFIKKGKL